MSWNTNMFFHKMCLGAIVRDRIMAQKAINLISSSSLPGFQYPIVPSSSDLSVKISLIEANTSDSTMSLQFSMITVGFLYAVFLLMYISINWWIRKILA